MAFWASRQQQAEPASARHRPLVLPEIGFRAFPREFMLSNRNKWRRATINDDEFSCAAMGKQRAAGWRARHDRHAQRSDKHLTALKNLPNGIDVLLMMTPPDTLR